MKTRIVNLLLIVGLLLLVVGEQPKAYVASGRYWASTPTWYINPLNNSGFTLTQIRAALEPAVDAWCAGGQTDANCDSTYGGTTNGRTLANNGKNEVFFSTSTNTTFFAKVNYWYNSSNVLLDADMVFYDVKYKYFTQTGCSRGIYLEDAGTHEFGHFFGLAHSSVSGATMKANTSYCNRSWISLAADDIAGIEFVYEPVAEPPPTNTAPTVTISSPTDASTHASTDSISFAATATDTQDGNIAANLRWSSNLVGEIGTGASFSLTLPVGVHVVTASVTDSGGLNGVDTHTISVNATSGNPTLSVRAWVNNTTKENKADLTWVDVPGSTVDIYRDGVKRYSGTVTAAINDGFQRDPINSIGTGFTYIYKVCAAGSTTTCTNEAAAVF